jgi:hypothetical protein
MLATLILQFALLHFCSLERGKKEKEKNDSSK